MIVQILNIFGKILLMIGFGFFLCRREIMDEEMKRKLSALLMKAILPINIVSSAGQTFSKENGFGMLLVLGISAGYYIIALLVMLLLTKCRSSHSNRSVLINLAVFANVGFIGFPVLGELLGQVGTLYTVAYNISYQLFFFSFGMFLLQEEGKLSVKALFHNSIIGFSLVSILIYFSGLRFPDFVQSTLSGVGGMMIPISMMIIGWEIANTRISDLYRDVFSYLVSALRLILFPLLLLVILKFCKVDNTVSMALVLLTALPSGSLTVIAAQEKGRNSTFAARAVAQSTLLMVFTLPGIYLLADWVLQL